MDRWDILIYAVAAYVAVTSLVRLMAGRRNKLIEQVREQIQNVHARKTPGAKTQADGEGLKKSDAA